MHQRQKAWWIRYGWLVLSLLVCCFSLHDQSFWIDECCTALCALQPDMQECWAKICGIGGSDAQIAFYYYLLFLWHQVTGAESEWGLRLFNVFWVLLAAWFFRKEPRALLILMVSPFLIYYTEELRPYILQIAASCGVSMLFYQVSRGASVKFHALFGTLFFLCLTSLTGVAWALGFAAAFLVMATPQVGSRSFWKAVCWWMIPFAVLAGYYVYTLTLGARAVEISSSWMVNAGASAYELMGLTGWGPPRTELRQYTTFASLWHVGGLKLAAAAGLVITAGLVYGMVRICRTGAAGAAGFVADTRGRFSLWNGSHEFPFLRQALRSSVPRAVFDLVQDMVLELAVPFSYPSGSFYPDDGCLAGERFPDPFQQHVQPGRLPDGGVLLHIPAGRRNKCASCV